MANDDLRQRVVRRLAQLKLGPVDAAKSAGLGRDYLRDFIEGRKLSFSAAKLPQVARALRWNVEDLQITPPRPSVPSTARLAMVPLLDNVTAGKLRSPASQIPLEDVPLLAFADLGRGEWFALRVDPDTDSMDRVSPPGSIVLVNKADRTLRNGKYYIFAVNGETTYKMWQDGEPSYLAPFSTNPANKPIFFKSRELEVIGRVRRTVLDL